MKLSRLKIHFTRLLIAPISASILVFSSFSAEASCLNTYRTYIESGKDITVKGGVCTAALGGLSVIVPPLAVMATISGVMSISSHIATKSAEKAKRLIQGAYAYLNYPAEIYSLKVDQVNRTLDPKEKKEMLNHFLKLAKEMKIQKNIEPKALAELIVKGDQLELFCTKGPEATVLGKKILKNRIRNDEEGGNLWRALGKPIPSNLSKADQKKMKKMLKQDPALLGSSLNASQQDVYNERFDGDTDALLGPQ